MITVILATHNGGETLERCLAAMAALESPPDGWELVLVNNASTDNTEKLALACKDRLRLTYLVEPRLGKSNAINTGLEHAQGDFIIFTDDDVLPDRDWLVQWRRAADTYPHCAVFGGKVIPEFEDARPPAYVPTWEYGALYGSTHNYAEGEIAPAPDTGVFYISGANIAIRAPVRDAGHRFDRSFLVGSDGLMGEDAEFVKRMSEIGYPVGFAPKAQLRHIVHSRQTSWRWIHHRLLRNGRAKFMLVHTRWNAQTGQFTFRFPWNRLLPALGSSLRFLLAGLRGDAKAAFKQSEGLMADLAAFSQALRLMLRRPTPPTPPGPGAARVA